MYSLKRAKFNEKQLLLYCFFLACCRVFFVRVILKHQWPWNPKACGQSAGTPSSLAGSSGVCPWPVSLQLHPQLFWPSAPRMGLEFISLLSPSTPANTGSGEPLSYSPRYNPTFVAMHLRRPRDPQAEDEKWPQFHFRCISLQYLMCPELEAPLRATLTHLLQL